MTIWIPCRTAKRTMPPLVIFATVCLAMAIFSASGARAAKGPPPAAKAPPPAAKAPPAPATPASAATTQPAGTSDANDLSLKIAALGTLYDLDLSPEQLKFLRGAAAATAESKARAAAKVTSALTQAMSDLHDALLKGDDTDRITDLREHVTELQDDDAVDLDDDVHVTDAARAKTAEVMRKIKASQLAAYLAEHADEVGDPVEQMTDALAGARDAGPDEDPEEDLKQTAEEVGGLVAGLDSAKAKQVSEQVAAWLKAGRQLKDDEYAARSTTFEETAKKIVGDMLPTQVLTNWIHLEVATLLSNPQLKTAVDEMLAAKAKEN